MRLDKRRQLGETMLNADYVITDVQKVSGVRQVSLVIPQRCHRFIVQSLKVGACGDWLARTPLPRCIQ